MAARPALSRRVATLLIATVAVVGLPVACASAKDAHRTGASRPYQIYLLKGLADVFSTGLDFLEAKLRSRGIVGEVHSHSEWEELADSAIAKWKSGNHGPIIIIGHSFGADAAIAMAHVLGEAGVPVALLVAFSPTDSAPVNANVAQAVTYYQSNSAFHGRIIRGAGFHGTLETVDLANAPGITHWNIEKANNLHAATIAKVISLVPHTTAAVHVTDHAPSPPDQDTDR